MKTSCFCLFWTTLLLATWLLFSTILTSITIWILKPSGYESKGEEWFQGWQRGLQHTGFLVVRNPWDCGFRWEWTTEAPGRSCHENIVWNTLFPQTSAESILQADIFQSSFRGPSHHWCQCHLKTFNFPKKSSALFRTGHDASRIGKSLKKMSSSFREEIKLKSPKVLGIFLTSNNAVMYCRLFLETWHSSLKALCFTVS